MIGDFIRQNGVAPLGTGGVDKIGDLEKTLVKLKDQKWYDTTQVKNFFIDVKADGSLTRNGNGHFLHQLSLGSDKGRIYQLFVSEGVAKNFLPGEFVHFEKQVQYTLKDGSIIDFEIDLLEHRVAKPPLTGTFERGYEMKSGLLDKTRKDTDKFTKVQKALNDGLIGDYELHLNSGISPDMEAWMKANAPDVRILRNTLLEP